MDGRYVYVVWDRLEELPGGSYKAPTWFARTTDGGATWEEQGKGPPDRGFFAGVMRDAMCVDDGEPAGVYLGSRDGSVYASADEGASWAPVAEHLPDVLCVRAATL